MSGLVLLLVFVTSILFFLAVFNALFFKNKQMKKRVQQYIFEEEHTPESKEKMKPVVEFRLAKERIRKNLRKKDKASKIEMKLHQAGMPISPEEFIMFQWISIALTAGILYLFVEQWPVLIIGAIIGFIIPKVVVAHRRKKRIDKFNDHLSEMISSIVSALRAGFSFAQALQNVEREAPSPVREEVQQLLKEMQYGSSLEESLNRMKDRVPSEDLDLMIQAIVIQRQVGGNLAIVLEKIVHTIRERVKIQGQIKTLTAQGRMSGVVVGALPAVLAGLLFLVNPEYMMVLFTTPIGIALLIFAGISSIIGFIFIQKITTIEV
ncbi:type II secretion system protein [Halalkalibacillus sediminis]|uniref:Type II secretion system protein n=1 Tax=Halalkalibacillus sediminis TaxID=2018042 RepID=A0A2I0QSH9_9BACI|nr:type II secretion system F family protein [Halalkalibacillus sediminis]PKR77264.1 type II secretion system protein [Halalkalibacillus sediminis]